MNNEANIKPELVEEAVEHLLAEGGPEKTPASRYFLLFFQTGESDSIDRSVAMQITETLARKVSTPPEETEIDMWLESGGGDAHSAYKIAAALQEYSSRLRVVVPDYAKSAATLMTLAADELYMSRTAELGPLDAQIEHPSEKDRSVSALDVAECTSDLAQTALGIVLRGGTQVLKITALDRRETLSELLSFAAAFTSPMVAKLDPMTMHWASGLLKVAEEYGKRLMKRDPLREPVASAILNALVKNYPSHGFVIDRSEARRIGLAVMPAEEYEHWAYVERVYYTTLKAGKSCVVLLSAEELHDLTDQIDKGGSGDATRPTACRPG